MVFVHLGAPCEMTLYQFLSLYCMEDGYNTNVSSGLE